MTTDRRRMLVHKEHSQLSISRQCALLGLKRSTYYYEPKGESAENTELIKIIDAQFLDTPFYGTRQMRRHLRNLGYKVGRRRVRRLMRKMGLVAVYQKPRTSTAHPAHKKYPYLLRGMNINKPNQVWCADITYIPMPKGHLYLVAIMDWYSRAVLAWRLSNTMDSDFCIAALEDAIDRHGVPEIFNTDQGSQFTSFDFTGVLKSAGIRISMDGKGRWMDNVFIERLWRSVKWECVYLREFETGSELKKGLKDYFHFYNYRRPHSFFDGKRPMQVYYDGLGSTSQLAVAA